MAIARARLQGSNTVVSDEEDAAVDAFYSFLRRAEDGAFSELANRDDLWRLLATMTIRKAMRQIRDQRAIKRGGGSLQRLSSELLQFESQCPSPEIIATMHDSVGHLLSLLADDELRRIVILRMEGHTNEEIAGKIGRSLPTVQRRLRLIRQKWQYEIDNE